LATKDNTTVTIFITSTFKLFGREELILKAGSKVNFGAENKNAHPKWGRRGGVSGGDAMRALGTT
jgi:hypothetical protein